MQRRAALIFFALLLLAPSLLSQQTAYTIVSKDGRRAIATTTINDQDYVALDDLAALFQLAIREDALGAITVGYKGKTILLTPDQPFASIAGRVVSLPAAPIRGAGRRWLVPIDFIARALALVYDARLTLRRPSRLVIIGDLRVPRVQVRYDTVATSGRLTIDATPRTASTITLDGDQLLVKFDADALDVANAASAIAAGALQGTLQSMRQVDATTLAFTVGPKFATFRVTTQPSDTATRQTIDLTPSSVAQAAEPAPAVPGVQNPPPDLATLAQGASGPVVRTIAIDPGHGGEDEGAHGALGTKEKDVTLAVARKLKAALESRLGIRVLLTRDDDRSVPIDDRTALANNSKADVLISLHANASVRPTLTGAMVFTALFEDRAEQTARTLQPELLPAAGGSVRDVEFVPWDMAQLTHLPRSMMLAQMISDAFHDHVPLAPNPLIEAPMRVLESANMPAVLVEMGFLTNGEQEKQLGGGELQNAIVQSLVDAVVKFRDALDDERRAPGGGR